MGLYYIMYKNGQDPSSDAVIVVPIKNNEEMEHFVFYLGLIIYITKCCAHALPDVSDLSLVR